MSESNSDNKETNTEEAVAKKPVAAKKTTAAKKKVAAKAKTDDAVAKKPKAVKKTTASKKVVANKDEAVAVESKTDDVVKTETDLEVATPVITAEKKEEKSYNTYYAIAASVLIAVVLSVVVVSSFFQNEYDSVVASVSSSFDEMTQDVDVVESTDQVATINTASNNGFQPFTAQPSQNVNFDDLRQQRRAAYEASLRQREAKIAELREFRDVEFKRIEQARIERLNRFDTLRTKTQAIQQEMHQKMQAAYDEFHSI
jgi:hypothetical protein